MPAMPEDRPRLLVSVRNAAEAREALVGGADILDLKEPRRGSLGMADVAAISSVIKLAAGESPAIPVSAALGEVIDWQPAQDIPVLPAGLSFAKLGTAKLGSNTNWQGDWRSVRRRFESSSVSAFHWIAVVYADWQLAGSPPPSAVIEAAILEVQEPAAGNVATSHPLNKLSAAAQGGRCVGVLFDTFTKNNGDLLAFMTADELANIAQQVHSAGLLLALAGGLQPETLAQVAGVQPDIIAIRSAACAHGQRDGSISAVAVREFKSALAESLAPPVVPHAN